LLKFSRPAFCTNTFLYISAHNFITFFNWIIRFHFNTLLTSILNSFYMFYIIFYIVGYFFDIVFAEWYFICCVINDGFKWLELSWICNWLLFIGADADVKRCRCWNGVDADELIIHFSTNFYHLIPSFVLFSISFENQEHLIPWISRIVIIFYCVLRYLASSHFQTLKYS
jgi:hypothetical protein